MNTLEYKTVAEWITYDEFVLGLFCLGDGWRLPTGREYTGNKCIWYKSGYADEEDYIHDAARFAILDWIDGDDDDTFEYHYADVKSESSKHYVMCNAHGKHLVPIEEEPNQVGCFVVVRENPKLRYAA
jgi:hypothetical protein